MTDMSRERKLDWLSNPRPMALLQKEPPNYDTVWSRYICYISLVFKATKPRVKPLFWNKDEQGNKTSRSMRCPTGARQCHIFFLYLPTNESMCLLFKKKGGGGNNKKKMTMCNKERNNDNKLDCL